jgi:chaperonin GroES
VQPTHRDEIPSDIEEKPMNIRPLHDRVVAKRREREEEIRGGIIIPDSAKEKPQEAEVIAVGPGKLDDKGNRSALDVKVGDRVLIGKYSGSEIKLGDQDLIILREDEILAVIE